MAFIARDDPLPKGAWGDITCTLYWCEEKYQWSKWIAEPSNFFTNLIFLYIALYGANLTRTCQLQKRFMLCSVAVGVVGLGSLAFHGTLLYEAQLLDEIPMIWTASVFAYSAYETSPGKPDHPILLPSLFIGTSILIPAAYVFLNHPVFHQVAYAALLLSAAGRVLWLLYSDKSPFDHKTSIGMRHAKEARKLLFTGTAVFLGGFGFWNIDNIFCKNLRDWRNELRAHHLGLIAPLINGHAIWHICTAVGAWLMVVSLTLVVECIKQGPENWQLCPSTWGAGWIFPSLKRLPKKIDTEPAKVAAPTPVKN